MFTLKQLDNMCTAASQRSLNRQVQESRGVNSWMMGGYRGDPNNDAVRALSDGGGGGLNIEQRAKPANPSRGIFTDV